MHLITFCKRSCVGNIVPQYNNVDLLSNNQNCYRTIKTRVVGVWEKFWYKQKLEKMEMDTLFRIISANTLYCSVLIYPFQDSQCEPEQYDTVENVIFHLWKRLIRKTQIHYMPETQSIRKKKKILKTFNAEIIRQFMSNFGGNVREHEIVLPHDFQVVIVSRNLIGK